ncbi:hypothetical protein V1511DRAFT_505982 [Dipodascopsis uninucleata]
MMNVAKRPSSTKLTYLKMKRPFAERGVNDCAILMAELFSCWAGTSLNSPQCEQIKEQMKDCYDNQKHRKLQRTSFNYHAQRLFPNIARKSQ